MIKLLGKFCIEILRICASGHASTHQYVDTPTTEKYRHEQLFTVVGGGEGGENDNVFSCFYSCLKASVEFYVDAENYSCVVGKPLEHFRVFTCLRQSNKKYFLSQSQHSVYLRQCFGCVFKLSPYELSESLGSFKKCWLVTHNLFCHRHINPHS